MPPINSKIPEIKEFFVSSNLLPSDNEISFNRTNTVDPTRQRMFKDNDKPDREVFSKLLRSIAFHKDPLSRARETADTLVALPVDNTYEEQGLVTIATNNQAIERNDGDVNNFTRTVRPSQIVINGSRNVTTIAEMQNVISLNTPVGVMFIFVDNSDEANLYVLKSSTAANNLPNVVRPLDYNVGSNEKVWFKIEIGGGSSVDNLNDISNVNVPTPSDGQVLSYDNINDEWIAITLPSGITLLANLDDTDINAPSDEQVLYYNGTNWINNDLPTLISTIFDNLTVFLIHTAQITTIDVTDSGTIVNVNGAINNAITNVGFVNQQIANHRTSKYYTLEFTPDIETIQEVEITKTFNNSNLVSIQGTNASDFTFRYRNTPITWSSFVNFVDLGIAFNSVSAGDSLVVEVTVGTFTNEALTGHVSIKVID